MLLKTHIFLIIFLLSFFISNIKATQFNFSHPHQHPDPEFVVQELQRRVNESFSRRKLLTVFEKDQLPCQTGNPIDDCWRCDPNWQANRQSLADCGIGFGHEAYGGKGGQIYVVTDSSDNNPENPTPGTLRFGAVQSEPLWITFSSNMLIKLNQALIIKSFKTIDGRGVDVHITGEGCFSINRVSNIIIHNIHIHHCTPSKGHVQSDGDGITIIGSINIWVDHCALSYCKDGLIDVTEGSTRVTISNNYFSHHDKVMLLGHSDKYEDDKRMQVTVAFNYFGEALIERMPRCRWGYFHVVNNDYRQWGEYAVGGSASPTINSQGNRYIAPSNANAKEVTARMDTDKEEWSKWNWRTEGDIMLNGAFFIPSGDGVGVKFAMASSLEPKAAELVEQLTMNAGVFGDKNKDQNIPGGGGGGGGGNVGVGGGGTGVGTGGGGPGGTGIGYYGMIYGSQAPGSPNICGSLVVIIGVIWICNFLLTEMSTTIAPL
ncbi:Pectate lyase [Thalictrum thalictroides]|uniref:Pectate lyase n=1 Tax=Thalictrum thalictroides TaxID=46969 RepID=A0A7J6WLQ7_THATH|nr:Pectate lyase [Thalictrum thalictroides]